MKRSGSFAAEQPRKSSTRRPGADLPSDGSLAAGNASSRAGSPLAAVGPENRNNNAGHRVLLDNHACRIRRTSSCRSILEEASSFEPWGQYLSVGGGGHLDLRGGRYYLGFNINTVGVILMVAGALGLVLSLLFWSSFSPYRRSRTVAGPDTVVEERRIERDLP